MTSRAQHTAFLLLAAVGFGGCSNGDSGTEEALSESVVDANSASSTGAPSAVAPSAVAPSGSGTSNPSGGSPAMTNPSGSLPVGGTASSDEGEELPNGNPPATPGDEEPPVGDPTTNDGSDDDDGAGALPTGAGSGDTPQPMDDEPGSGGGPNQGEAPGGGGSAGDPVNGEDDEDPEPVVFPTCPDETWRLVWGDDFDGPAGSAVDGSKWAYDSGPNWYNGELQYYAAGSDNASLDGQGNLVIEARREDREGRQYTSARLKTEGKHTFSYGRIEGRMKLPYGQGMWPAFWMLGGTSWPNDGEIDVMENLGREPTISHGTIHGPGYSGAAGPGASFTLPDGAVFSDDFHIFAVEWEQNEIRWYVDGEHFSTKTPADIGNNRWVFDHPFFIIINLAVGGEWPGNPDETTVFPQHFVIDYIRVCERQ